MPKDLERWQKTLTELTEQRQKLIAVREDAYLAYRKYEIDPGSSEAKSEKEQAFRQAVELTTLTREFYKKLLKEKEKGEL